MSATAACNNLFDPQLLNLQIPSLSLEGTSSRKSAKLNNINVIAEDLTPLYDDAFTIISEHLVLEYKIPFLFVQKGQKSTTHLPGTVNYLDAPGDEPQLWTGNCMPQHQLLDRANKVIWSANSKTPCYLQEAQNPLVYRIVVKAIEECLMRRFCAWYKVSHYATTTNFLDGIATIQNMRLTGSESEELRMASINSAAYAKEYVDQEVRNRFVAYNPMTISEADALYEAVSTNRLSTIQERILCDAISRDDTLYMLDSLILSAREHLQSFYRLEECIKSNPWGYFKFSLDKRATGKNNILLSYHGDYRILQWEQEHLASFPINK